MQVLLLCVASLGAGFVDAIAGGGGLITLPALLGAGLAPHLALGTNKGQAVFGATTSVISFWRKGALTRARIPSGFLGGFIGSLIGARTVLWIDPKPLRPLIVILLAVALVAMLIPKPTRASASPVSQPDTRPGWRIAFPLALGFYDGFFGPGTGALLIAGYIVLFGDTPTVASANAKVANFASNLAAVLLFALNHRVQWSVSIPMAMTNMVGAFIGVRAALRVGDRLVRVVWLLVTIALIAKVILT